MSDFAEFERQFEPQVPPPRPVAGTAVDDRGWWLLALAGVALVTLGLWMLTNLYESVVVLALLVGASLIISGVVEVLAFGGSDRIGWPAWLGGGLLAISGAVVLGWPDATLRVLVLLAGLGLLVGGLVRAVDALSHRDLPDWPLELGLGGFGVASGLVVLAWPEATLVVVSVILGVRAVGTGLLAIGTGWQLHRLAT
ncbi:MAG: HdeD family acid-resistance protein [Acidimicrobiales bacterium]